MLKLSTVALLVAAWSGLAQTLPPEVRPVLTRAEAQSLSRDPSAVLADPVAVAALAAFVAPMQQHAPEPSLLSGFPDSVMVPVSVSGALLWVSVATDAPEDAYPWEVDAGSELVWDRYVVDGNAEPLTNAQAVCPSDGAGYRVWEVAGVGPVEGCVGVREE